MCHITKQINLIIIILVVVVFSYFVPLNCSEVVQPNDHDHDYYYHYHIVDDDDDGEEEIQSNITTAITTTTTTTTTKKPKSKDETVDRFNGVYSYIGNFIVLREIIFTVSLGALVISWFCFTTAFKWFFTKKKRKRRKKENDQWRIGDNNGTTAAVSQVHGDDEEIDDDYYTGTAAITHILNVVEDSIQKWSPLSSDDDVVVDGLDDYNFYYYLDD